MPRPRNAHRNHSDFELWSGDVSTGWQWIKHVSYAYGEMRCDAGEWKRLYSKFGEHVAYQPVAPRHDATESSDASRAALGVPEMQANADLMGRSRTAQMKAGDPRRIGRKHPQSGRLLPEEDFVERAKNLVKQYPQSANFRTGDRAVRVYPKAPLEATYCGRCTRMYFRKAMPVQKQAPPAICPRCVQRQALQASQELSEMDAARRQVVRTPCSGGAVRQ